MTAAPELASALLLGKLDLGLHSLRCWHAWLFTGRSLPLGYLWACPVNLFPLQLSGWCLLRQEQAAAAAAARPGRLRHGQQSVRPRGEDAGAANHGEWLSSRTSSHSCWTLLHGQRVAMAVTHREAVQEAHICVDLLPNAHHAAGTPSQPRVRSPQRSGLSSRWPTGGQVGGVCGWGLW